MEDNAVVAKPKQWAGSLMEFRRDISAEMKKVTWPGRSEVLGTTVVVLVTTIVFGVFLWVCDYGFGQAIIWLLRKFGANI